MKMSRPVLYSGSATAFSLLGDQALYAILPTYYLELGLFPWHVGLLLSVNRFIRVFINHWVARICKRLPVRPLFVVALFVGATLTLIYALTDVFALLLIARLTWGFCWAIIRQIGLMTVAENSAERIAGRSMGFYSGLSRLGSVAGNFFGGLGHDLMGYTGILTLFSGISLLALPLGSFSFSGDVHSEVRDNEKRKVVNAGKGVVFGGFAIGFVGQGALMSTLGLFLTKEIGTGITLGSFFIGVATLTGGLMATRWLADLLAPLLGALSDLWGRRFGSLVFLIVGSCALGAAGLEGNLSIRVFCIILFFVCATGASVALVAEAGLRGATAVASYVTAVDLGACAGPLAGWMMPQFGFPIGWIFYGGSIAYGIAAIIFATTRYNK
ncbi:MAG: MFS transporter [Candidatus Latescibacterota bacterium]|nr:MFS transporter [Candidatus Latescibacterota bacterium]